jgi:gluconokinase
LLKDAHLLKDEDSAPRPPHPSIIASGGALLSSPAWLQLTADVMGRPIITSAEREATSRGLAVLALEQLGSLASAADLPAAMGRTYTPNAAHYDRHRDALAQQTELYAALLDQDEGGRMKVTR